MNIDLEKMISLFEHEWNIKKDYHPLYKPKHIWDEVDKLEQQQFKLFDSRYPSCPKNNEEWKLRYSIQDHVRRMKCKYFK